MRRVCSECGSEFEGQSRDTRCPVCRKNVHPIERERKCQQCGCAYKSMAARTLFCPACAEKRKKEARNRYLQRKKAGKIRPLGSTDICTECGGSYVVAGGLQMRCPSCSERIRDDYSREHAIATFYSGGKERRDQRVAGRAMATEKCIVCGKEFHLAGDRLLCCSPECSKIHADNLRRKWGQDNHERKRENDRRWWAENGAERNRKRKEARKIEREKEGVTMPGDKDYKAQWDKENAIHAHVKINKNQDPDLYAILENAESRGGVVRQLMRLGLKALNENTDQGEDGGTAG